MYESFSFKNLHTVDLNAIAREICDEWDNTFGDYRNIIRVTDKYIRLDTELNDGSIGDVQIFAQAWIPIINCIQLLTTDTMGNKRYTMLDPTTYQLYFQGGELKIPISRFIIQDLDATPPEQYEKELVEHDEIARLNEQLLKHEENIKCLWKTIQRMQEEIKQQNY